MYLEFAKEAGALDEAKKVGLSICMERQGKREERIWAYLVEIGEQEEGSDE